MAGVIEKLAEFGIPLGERGSARYPVLAGLEKKGVIIPPKTVQTLRSGRYSGQEVVDRVQISRLLKTISESGGARPVEKNTLYLKIALEATGKCQLQTHPNHPRRHQRWQSFGLTKAVAEALKLSISQVRRSLISMRADFASSVKPGNTPFDVFTEGVDDFCKHYGAITIDSSPLALDLEPWRKEKTSIPDFYKSVYPKDRHRGGSSIGVWLSYELPALASFYEANPAMTPLDKVVLRSYLPRLHVAGTMANTAAEIRMLTGVPVDRGIIDLHKNALVRGTLLLLN